MVKRLKYSLAGIIAVIAAKKALFRTVGLVFIEDIFALHLGAEYGGVTLGNIILILSAGTIIWYFFEREKKSK